MMDKNDIRHITTPSRGGFMDVPEALNRLSVRKYSIDKLLETDLPLTKMAELTGMTVYEIRRYTGSIQ
jgi:hypothetical protein